MITNVVFVQSVSIFTVIMMMMTMIDVVTPLLCSVTGWMMCVRAVINVRKTAKQPERPSCLAVFEIRYQKNRSAAFEVSSISSHHFQA